MQFIVQDTVEAVSGLAAERIVEEIRHRPDLLLAAASGATPTPVYQRLGHMASDEPELFGELRIVKLDEWGGLAMDDPASCESYLRKHLTEPLQISNDRYWSFQSDPEDPQEECNRIQRHLQEQGPIDICVLGLGVNGHLGFNEPAEFLRPWAHVAKLSSTTLRHPMLDGAHGNTSFGMTLGMADLLHARRILLLVTGSAKQQALQRLASGRMTTEFPASLLWLHPNAVCLCDSEAAAQVKFSSICSETGICVLPPL